MTGSATISIEQLASDRHRCGLPEAEGVDVLIHVGLHKTATTWLQEQVFHQADDIVYEHSFLPTHRAFLRPPANEFSLDTVREEFGALLDRARRTNRPLVISDEALGGRAFQQKYFREVAALRLRAAFPAAKIFISVREQNALLASLYGEYLRCGYSSTLDRFLARQSGNPNIEPPLDFSFYEYDRTLGFYEDLFGRGYVLALPMEWTLSHASEFMERIGKFLGHSLKLPDRTQTRQKVRPAYSSWARAVQRVMNGFESQDSRSLIRRGRLSSNSIAYQIDRLTPDWARRRGQDREKQKVAELVGDYYAESNARFAPRCDFDLASLGYRVTPTATDISSASRGK